MGGEISVDSEVGQGSVFSVVLPVMAVSGPADPAPKDASEVSPLTAVSQNDDRNPDEQKPILLLIEDSPGIVVYLQSCLRSLYRLELAYNGQEGIGKALEIVPDLIISDVMMPLKDGFEVTDVLKNDDRTSHIPIVLLTARDDVQSRLEGLRRGADAYLAKPFEREELLVRLEKLFELRVKLREHFRQTVFSENSTPATATEAGAFEIEDIFIQKIKDILSENIADENFGLPQLCLKLGMSRSQLFRKMKAVTGESPSGFIRSYRLHRARHLLQTTNLSVSEIGFQVGFKDPAHFSKTFQETFGMPPSVSRG